MSLQKIQTDKWHSVAIMRHKMFCNPQTVVRPLKLLPEMSTYIIITGIRRARCDRITLWQFLSHPITGLVAATKDSYHYNRSPLATVMAAWVKTTSRFSERWDKEDDFRKTVTNPVWFRLKPLEQNKEAKGGAEEILRYSLLQKKTTKQIFRRTPPAILGQNWYYNKNRCVMMIRRILFQWW